MIINILFYNYICYFDFKKKYFLVYEGEFFKIIKISKEYIICIYYFRSDIDKFIICLICKY